MKKLVALIQQAVALLSVDGIEGWGISAPDEVKHLFREVVTGSQGCTSSTCRCVSHDPRSDVIKLIPHNPDVTITCLGSEYEQDYEEEYYHICWTVTNIKGESRTYEEFLSLYKPNHYRATLRMCAPDAIPEYLLANLVLNKYSDVELKVSLEELTR